MPSADFCRFIASPLDDTSPEANRQISPGIAHSPSRLCPPHIRHDFPCRYRTLKRLAFSSSPDASYAVSVRRASVLPAASSGFHLAMDTLAVQLTIPPAGFVRDFHPQVSAPCRAHPGVWTKNLNRRGREHRFFSDFCITREQFRVNYHFVP